LLPSLLFSAAPTDFSDALFTFHSVIAVVLIDKSVIGHDQLLQRAGEHTGDRSLAAYSGKDNKLKDATSEHLPHSHLVGVLLGVLLVVFGARRLFWGDSRSHPELTAVCLAKTALPQCYKKSRQ